MLLELPETIPAEGGAGARVQVTLGVLYPKQATLSDPSALDIQGAPIPALVPLPHRIERV